MKHSQRDIGRVGPVNRDGHAIGIDIGATSVRVAIMALGTMDGRPSVTVHGLDSAVLPPTTVVNGVVSDPAALTAALKHLWDKNDFGCRNVILGIAGPQVVVRDLRMPNVTLEQRDRALPFQAREVVALPMEEVILDFAQLGEPDPETNQVSGLLVATPRQPVVAAVNAVERASLKVARVDLSSFAVLRAIADEHLSVEAVIDLGAHLTTIVIHNRGVPKLVRTLPRGGAGLTERLADHTGLSLEEAERAKVEVGLVGAPEAVSAALNEAIRPLLAEIRSSINYFMSSGEGAALERISLTGGGSRLRGLAKILAQQNGIPTNVVPPMQHIRNRLAASNVPADFSDVAASAVSVGLAMGAAA
jgi:type IV pilus assembly protein PilM